MIEPGGETSVKVKVYDSNNAPIAGAEVALIVVDESVLALSGYDLANPLNTFYPHRPTPQQSINFCIRSDIKIEAWDETKDISSEIEEVDTKTLAAPTEEDDEDAKKEKKKKKVEYEVVEEVEEKEREPRKPRSGNTTDTTALIGTLYT